MTKPNLPILVEIGAMMVYGYIIMEDLIMKQYFLFM